MGNVIDQQAERREAQRRSALAAADAQMQVAKQQFTAASLACLRGSLDAAQQVQRALLAIEGARAALREVGGE